MWLNHNSKAANWGDSLLYTSTCLCPPNNLPIVYIPIPSTDYSIKKDRKRERKGEEKMKTSIHKGSLNSIPPTASPGLQFLKSFLPALDSLDPNTKTDPISRFVSPKATFMINSNPPTGARDVVPLLRLRGRHLSLVRHEVDIIWDIERDGDDDDDNNSCYSGTGTGPGSGSGSGGSRENQKHQRTVMFEGTSVTVFKEDEEQFEIRLREFNVIDLEGDRERNKDRDRDRAGSEGLQIVEMRTYMDVRPLQDRAARMQPESVEVPE